MNKTIILLTTIFILTSCYSNPEDIKKIAKLEKQIEKNNEKKKILEKNNEKKYKRKKYIFENDLKCKNLKKSVIKSIERIKDEFSHAKNTKLNNIFYSFKTNSCLYISSRRRIEEGVTYTDKFLYEVGNDCGDCEFIEWCRKFYYNDKLYNEYLINTSYGKTEDDRIKKYNKDQKGCDDFDDKIKKMKQ